MGRLVWLGRYYLVVPLELRRRVEWPGRLGGTVAMRIGVAAGLHAAATGNARATSRIANAMLVWPRSGLQTTNVQSYSVMRQR
jgi:hypothetical protein